MTTRKTPRGLAAAGVALVLACAGLAAHAEARPDGPGDGVPELRYLPADVAVVAYADVKEVMGSSATKRLRGLQPQAQQVWQRFEEGTGVDLESDVDAIVLGVLPHGGETAAVAIARGRFDNARIESYALERGGVGESYQGIGFIARGNGDASSALAFLAPELIASGQSAAVRRVVDCLRGADSATTDAALMKRIGALAGDSSFWAVARLDSLPRSAPLPGAVSTHLSAIEWLSVSARLSSGATGSLRAETRDEEAGARLRDALHELLATVRLRAVDKPDLQSLVQSLEPGGTGNTVSLSFELPAQFFESLADRAPQPAQP